MRLAAAGKGTSTSSWATRSANSSTDETRDMASLIAGPAGNPFKYQEGCFRKSLIPNLSPK